MDFIYTYKRFPCELHVLKLVLCSSEQEPRKVIVGKPKKSVGEWLRSNIRLKVRMVALRNLSSIKVSYRL
jgi:hypothetical protein